MSHAVPFHRAAAGFPYRSDKSRRSLGADQLASRRMDNRCVCALNGSTTCTGSAAEPAGRVLWAGMSIVLSTRFFVESVRNRRKLAIRRHYDNA